LSDLRRQLASARTERDQLRTENKALRSILGDIPPEYAKAYANLCDLAYHGLGPDDLGAPINNGHATSRPPKYHPLAYHQRNEERRALRARCPRILGLTERIYDGRTIHPPNGPTVVVHYEVHETA
jgi:hypothetical protein